MNRAMRGLVALGVLLSLSVAMPAQDDSMVDNPRYKHWANFKNGSFATLVETTKYSGEAKDVVPGGIDVKVVTYRLASIGKNQAIVTTVVVEEEELGTIESAPTRITYKSKVKKATLEAVLDEHHAKPGDEETVKIGKEELKCKTVSGKYTRDGATYEFKVWTSDSVPGGVVKRTRTAKKDDKVVAETTIMLRAYKAAEEKKKK